MGRWTKSSEPGRRRPSVQASDMPTFIEPALAVLRKRQSEAVLTIRT